jgi:hypothetical protein
MSTKRPPAICGVSADKETLITVVYPSIACTGLGKGLGRLYESIPAKLGGVKLSHWLFPLPTAPLAALAYLMLKASGDVYVLTNRSVQRRRSLGNRLVKSIPLTEVEEVEVVQGAGQQFYPAADLVLLNNAGNPLLQLQGVPRAEVFRNLIIEARDARRQVEASLATIRARQPVAGSA